MAFIDDDSSFEDHSEAKCRERSLPSMSLSPAHFQNGWSHSAASRISQEQQPTCANVNNNNNNNNSSNNGKSNYIQR